MSPTSDDIPHGLEGYRRYGCKCVICRTANASYHRKHRAELRKTVEVPNVTSITAKRGPGRPPKVSRPIEQVIGEYEQAVIDECALLEAATARITSVLGARRMAHILDDAGMQKDWPTALRQMNLIMDSLRSSEKKKQKGRLAVVSAMVSGKVAES